MTTNKETEVRYSIIQKLKRLQSMCQAFVTRQLASCADFLPGSRNGLFRYPGPTHQNLTKYMIHIALMAITEERLELVESQKVQLKLMQFLRVSLVKWRN